MKYKYISMHCGMTFLDIHFDCICLFCILLLVKCILYFTLKIEQSSEDVNASLALPL